MQVELNTRNYKNISQLVEIAKENQINKLEISFSSNLKETPKMVEAVSFLYDILDYEEFFKVSLINFPYCIVSEASRDHVFFKKEYVGEKTFHCKHCRYNKNCRGFPPGYLGKYGKDEVCSIPDLPFELMLEVLSACNFNCEFCFNKFSFAQKNRPKISPGKKFIKQVIEKASYSNIKNIRFTGGEPLLRKDILELMTYAKERNLYVILNTNASLITKQFAKSMKKMVDNVLIPIESWDNKKESKITGHADSLIKKIKAINYLKEEGLSTIRVGTVATPELIKNFQKIDRLIKGLPIDEWEFYRPIGISERKMLKSSLIEELVERLIKIKQENRSVYIANSLPFCSIKNPNKINSVSKGSLFDEGHSRMVMDPRGFLKPHYFLDYNIGTPLDPVAAWRHPFMEKIRDLRFAPQECKGCFFLNKCCGGSRHMAKKVTGSYFGLDPMAFKLKKQ